MKFEITETELKLAYNDITVYRYDCFIDDAFMEVVVWTEPQEPHSVYQHFFKIVLREWKTKYKTKYSMKKITKHGMEGLNKKTIVSEEIKDINLTLKQAQQFIREQRLMDDFK